MRWVRADMVLRQVLVDLSTQHDFLDANGAVPVRNRQTLLPYLRQLMTFARTARIPIISSMDAHREHDLFDGMARHCVDGTVGQNKLAFTLLSPRILIEANNCYDLPYNIMSRYRQVLFRKRDRDFFGNPKADRLLTELEPGEYVIFGVGLEQGVKAAALGLLARHKKVAVIADACGYWSEAEADLSIRQMHAKGIRITTLEQFMAATPLPRRIPRRARPADPSGPREPVQRTAKVVRRKTLAN